MNEKEKVSRIIEILSEEYPDVYTTLDHENEFEFFVSVLLSTQTRDDRVNEVGKTLFKKYKSFKDLSKADLKKLQKEIKPIGIYRTKARNLKKTSQIIVEKYNSKIPDKMEELLELPGVGRKVASIVLSRIYSKQEGIAVDTHVNRLSQRLRLTKNKTQDKIERDLMDITPREEWDHISLLLIWHGRRVCSARSPKCPGCVLSKICRSAKIFHPEVKI